jgi:hypothetical protein
MKTSKRKVETMIAPVAELSPVDARAESLYADLLRDPRWAREPERAAHEARRRAEAFDNPQAPVLDDPNSGFEDLEALDFHSYATNLPAWAPINVLSALQEDFSIKPDLTAARAAARRMRLQTTKERFELNQRVNEWHAARLKEKERARTEVQKEQEHKSLIAKAAALLGTAS